MIAYLDKYDTTVEVPDDVSQGDLADINNNFHSYVDVPTAASKATQPNQPQTQAEPSPAATVPLSSSPWQPNFYESAIKPSLEKLLGPAKAVATFPETPEAQALGGKMIEQGTFGLAKPLTDVLFSQQYKDHPAMAGAGALVGGLGSLLEAGAAVRAVGVGAAAAKAGQVAVEAGLESGSRFIPRAIMSGATFGTRAFIAETVKAFEDGGVNLEQFGKDVLKDTAFGATFGAIGGLTNAAASVSSAGALGFLSSKMDGADNREASLNAAIWAAFETVGSVGRSEELRLEALRNLKGSIGEYAAARNPNLDPKDAQRVASAFVDNSIRKAGYDTAEDIAKSGPENLLEGIEKLNQAIRTAKIPTGSAPEAPALPKLPAPVYPGETRIPDEAKELTASPERPAGSRWTNEPGSMPGEPTMYLDVPNDDLDKAKAVIIANEGEQGVGYYTVHDAKGNQIGGKFAEPEEAAQFAESKFPVEAAPQTPYDKAVDFFKDLFGVPKEQPAAKPAELPAPKVLEPDEQAFEQSRVQKVDMEKSLGEIAERFQALGMKPNEGAAIFDIYGLDRKGALGQAAPLADLVRRPIEEQYDELYAALAKARGIETKEEVIRDYSIRELLEDSLKNEDGEIQDYRKKYGIDDIDLLAKAIHEDNPSMGPESPETASQTILSGKPDARTMEQARNAVDLINDYFNPQSQMVFDFAKQHPDASDHDVAQMAYNRGLIEEPNNDLLKMEIEKAKQEKIVTPKVNAMIAPGATAKAPKPSEAEPTPAESKPLVVANKLVEYKDEIKNVVAPYTSAPLASQIMREELGIFARRLDQAEFALRAARKMFDKMPDADIIEFYDRAEKGIDQGSKELNGIDQALKKPLADLADEINKETGRLQERKENYLPHYWKQGDQAIPIALKNASKRPLEGSKGFLKQRTIETQKQGIQYGLEPEFRNPVDAVRQKLIEMGHFLTARRTLNHLKESGLAKFTRLGQDHPEGWRQINDNISDVYKSPMIAVQEAYDEHLMSTLNNVAKSLGIDLERKMQVRAEGAELKNLLGVSISTEPGAAGKIETRFASPESTLAHELGHQLDNIYGLQSKFLTDRDISKELSALARERYAGKEVSRKFENYVQKPEEKIAVLFESFVHAPDLLKEKAPKAYQKLVEFLKDPDPINGPSDILKPLADIKPSLVKGTNEGEVHAGGAVIAGHIYVQPDAARIINNYLSPGFSKSAIFRGARFTGNLINQFQLGFSAFHLNFTSTESMATQLDIALRGLLKGDLKAFVSHGAKTLVAPVQTIIRGDDLLKAWRGDGQSPIDEQLANILAISGGRAHMDDLYATKMADAMMNNFRSGKFVKGILQIPLATLDAASKPIMEYVVPRMKLGIFAEIMQMELEKNPDMTHDEMREIGTKIWDTIDDRMGQVVYDNLFWNNSYKHSLQLMFRSVGWNHGLVRLAVGGGQDAVDLLNDVLHARKPDIDKAHRLFYWIASAMLVGTMNSLYQYVKTGKPPSELKDLVFPKNGGVDEHGVATRSIPFQNYFKDLYHFAKHPATTIFNKSNPLLSIVHQALTNKDFYGDKITDSYDPDKGIEGIIRQIEQEAKFLIAAPQPFSYRNMQHTLNGRKASLESVVGPWMGDTPAPYDIDRTKAEELAHDFNAEKRSIGGRTPEQVERAKLISELTKQYAARDPQAVANIFTAYQSGAISHRQMKEIMSDRGQSPIQKMFKHLDWDESQRVYRVATEEEKAQLQTMMERKQQRHARDWGGSEQEFVAQ